MARKKLVRSPFRSSATPEANGKEQAPASGGTAMYDNGADKSTSLELSSGSDTDDEESFGGTEQLLNSQSLNDTPFGLHTVTSPPSQKERDNLPPGGNRHPFANGVQTPPLVRMAISGIGSRNVLQDSNDVVDLEKGRLSHREEKREPVQCKSMRNANATETPARHAQDYEENGVYSWTDAELAERYSFEKEIGYGNWGSCWLVRSRTERVGIVRDKPYAIKLVHRQGTPPSNARVKALWNEYKVLRACGTPIHPNLVHFKEFAITPSYALVVMDHYRQAMNVALPESLYAGPRGYFHQLLSSVAWLHERCVTHCDIKVANLLVDMSKDKIRGHPVLVDFGFATLHDERSHFHSSQTWGTPEYLSPERSRGDRHDERLSDIWALGVTFFEIATGRTPFEHEEEQFLTKEQLDIYYKRTLVSEWVGDWSISTTLEKLCKSMLAPDPARRLFADQAMQHRFFSTTVPDGAEEEKTRTGQPAFRLVDGTETESRGDEQFEDKASVKRLSANCKRDEITLDRDENNVMEGEDSINFFSEEGAVQKSQKGTPPALPPKDCRREQIRIVVDETDDESSQKRSSVSFEKSSSIQQSRPVSRESSESNAKTVGRKKFHLFRQSSSSLDSGSTARASATVKGEVRGMRNSPYPPSTSQKLKTLRPATSSSERRHSPQTQDFRRPATVHGEETANTYSASYSHSTAKSTGFCASVNEQLTRDDQEVAHKKLKSDNTLATSKVAPSHEQDTMKPVRESFESTKLVKVSSNGTFPIASFQAHVPARAMDARNLAYETTSLVQSNTTALTSLSELQTHDLERRLEEMDHLAATLMDMVREIRIALQGNCEKDGKETLSRGINTTIQCRPQSQVSISDAEKGETKGVNLNRQVENSKLRQGRPFCDIELGLKEIVSPLETKPIGDNNHEERGPGSQKQSTSPSPREDFSDVRIHSGSIRKGSASPWQASVTMHLASCTPSSPQATASENSSTPSSTFKLIKRGLGGSLSRSNNEGIAPGGMLSSSTAQGASSGNVLHAILPQKSPLLKSVAAEAKAEKESLSSSWRAQVATAKGSATSSIGGKRMFSISYSPIATSMRKGRISDAEKKPFSLSRSNSTSVGVPRQYNLIPQATQSLSSRRRTTITDISDIGESEWNLAHSPSSSQCIPLTPHRQGHAGNRQPTTAETWTQARQGRQTTTSSSPELASFGSKIFSATGTVSGASSPSTAATSNIGYDPPRSHKMAKRGLGAASPIDHHHGHAHSISSGTGTSGALWRMLTNRVTANRNARHVAADRW